MSIKTDLLNNPSYKPLKTKDLTSAEIQNKYYMPHIICIAL